MVQQISVFLENSKGKLAHITETLGQAGIDLYSLSIADTASFGILRIVVGDTDRALKVLREEGYAVNVTELFAIAVPDTSGGLAHALRPLSDAGVGIEYLYSYVRRASQTALILFKTDDVAKAAGVLETAGIHELTQGEIA